MGGLLAMLNHLAATWLAGHAGAGAGWRFTDITLDAQGALLRAEISQGGFAGEVQLRLVAGEGAAGRQSLQMKVERWPETIPPALEPFRKMLETARLTLELDFNS